MLIPSVRASDCDACGGPHPKWVGSLAMALCALCEREGAHHPERDPVLLGEVLAGAVLGALWRSKAQRGSWSKAQPGS
ncbi:hypothetical protein ACFRJ1_18845 [Streptomyces sp. NPDC056773]|uniref:hypothetical protein n=1 Tax=unclassified Streptomyces TaxID=2593676 RepID=UPI00367C9F06